LEEEMVNVDGFSWVGKNHIKPQKLKIHRHFNMVWPSETVRKANLVVISNTLLGNNISPPKALEDDFLFPRWDMLVSYCFFPFSPRKLGKTPIFDLD